MGLGVERVELDEQLVGAKPPPIVPRLLGQRGQLPGRVDGPMVVFEMGLQMRHRPFPIVLLEGDGGQRQMGAAVAGGHRGQGRRLLERGPRCRGVAVRPQGMAQRHLDGEALGMLVAQLPQVLDPGLALQLPAPLLRARADRLRVRQIAAQPAREHPIPLLRTLHRPAQRPEPRLHGHVERRLEGVEVQSDPVEGRLGVEPVPVGPQEIVDGRLAVRVDDVLDEDRGLEVRDRNGLGPREAAVEIAERQHVAPVEVGRELQVLVARPVRPRPLLLEGREPLRQPPRDALVRHLQGDHVGHLVPQRRLPVELAGTAGAGRVERHHLAETGAQRPDHAGQAQGPHREVIVLREHLDQNRHLRLHAVAGREVVQRPLAELDHVVLQHRGLVGMEPDDQVALLERLELVEGVEHLQQVEGDDVVRILLERPFQGPPRPRLVAGPEQVHAELGVAPRVGGIELQPPAHQRRRLLETVVAGGEVAGDPVDLAVGRIDLEHPPDLGLEVVQPVLDIGDRGHQRPRLEAPIVDGEGAIERRPAGLVVTVVEAALGQEQVRVQIVGIDLDGPARRRARLRGVGVRKGPGHPQKRRRPVLVDLERGDVGLRGLRLIVLLAEQVAPEGLHRGVVGSDPGRVPQQRVGLPVAAEGPRGAGGPVQVDGVGGALQPVDEHPQPGRRLVAPAQVLVQQRQLQSGRADRILGRDRSQALFRRVVLAAENVETRQQRCRRRVRGVPVPRQGPRLVIGAVGQRARRRAVELVLLRPRVPLLGRRRDRPRPHGADDDRGAEHTEAGTSAGHTAPPLHQILNGPIISTSGTRRATPPGAACSSLVWTGAGSVLSCRNCCRLWRQSAGRFSTVSPAWAHGRTIPSAS